MVRTIQLTFALLLGSVALALGQSTDAPLINTALEGLYLRRADSPIVIDGIPDETAWLTGSPANGFWETFPSDTSRCAWRTEVYMTYDDDHLYIGARCYSPGQNYIIPSLRRDYSAGGNDNLTFLLDPFQDRTSAFVFGMNPLGVMREAFISNGGRSNDDWLDQWDNRWRGQSAIFPDHWSCELAIPFSSLRFPEGRRDWYFNSYRFDTQSNTRSTWQPIPQNQMIMNLAYMGNMQWEEAPQVRGKTFTIIPYLTGGVQRNHEAALPTERTFNAGADIKIPVTTGLNLDLTANPDFSQVEVDQQVINLDRFEVFFPERRQFFLENADLFSTFGHEQANPFFSRRIGIARDGDGVAFATPVYYGARLSGKLDNNWRVGLLNMQAAKDDARGLPAYNYTLAAVQRKLFARSNIGLIAVNKQSVGSGAAADTLGLNNAYNRVVGLDYNLASTDNRWVGKAYFHQSFSPDQKQASASQGMQITHRVRRYAFSVQQRYVGADFNAEMGFVPRTNYVQTNTSMDYFFYPERGRVNRHGPQLNTRLVWTPGTGSTDRSYFLSWFFNFTNNSNLSLTALQEYIYLLDAFDPTRTAATPLPGATGYTYNRFTGEYQSDSRRRVSFSVNPSVGEFFNGYRYGLQTRLTWRYQPYGQISLATNYNYIDLPAPYATTALFLIGPRIDLTFTKNLFLTTFFQYNDQIDNVNINARLQWRFAPVSDFFLVYTDNYNSLDWRVKNRGLVAKLTYWLNT